LYGIGIAPEPAQLREGGGMERPRTDARDAERLEPLPHLARGLVRERDREDLLRRERAPRDLVRDPARDRRRLPRAGAREDADRAANRLDGAALLRVQALEDAGGIHRATLARRCDGAFTSM
jgi:hypothetical protein